MECEHIKIWAQSTVILQYLYLFCTLQLHSRWIWSGQFIGTLMRCNQAKFHALYYHQCYVGLQSTCKVHEDFPLQWNNEHGHIFVALTDLVRPVYGCLLFSFHCTGLLLWVLSENCHTIQTVTMINSFSLLQLGWLWCVPLLQKIISKAAFYHLPCR